MKLLSSPEVLRHKCHLSYILKRLMITVGWQYWQCTLGLHHNMWTRCDLSAGQPNNKLPDVNAAEHSDNFNGGRCM